MVNLYAKGQTRLDMSAIFANGSQVTKSGVTEAHGVIDAPLGKDERSGVAIKDCVRADGAPARTEFWVERHVTRDEGAYTLLRVVPLTGRKHQIRLQLSHAGFPILGDRKYGSTRAFPSGIALHARRLVLAKLPDRVSPQSAIARFHGAVSSFSKSLLDHLLRPRVLFVLNTTQLFA